MNCPPHQLFELFFEYLCQQANLYAPFKRKMTFSVEKVEVGAFIAILRISYYSVVLQRRIIWEQSEDVHHSSVSQLIDRDRFDEILWYLHLANNKNLAASDKLAKARLFYKIMNEPFLKSFQLEENLCVAKAIISSHGKHSAKQYIEKKPIKFGYKLWYLNSRLGYLVPCEPYSGKSQTVPVFGLRGSVVTKPMKPLPENLSF